MLNQIIPKLPMRDKNATRNFYTNKLGFEDIGAQDFEGYLIVKKDQVEIHFFEHKTLNVLENYGQVYIRVINIDDVYLQFVNSGVPIHPNGSLELKPWMQKEFSILDPDNNLLTFGEAIS
jgi:catechol 2,3-dioxygenase-like lactoylglutathione lyase family enzyme